MIVCELCGLQSQEQTKIYQAALTSARAYRQCALQSREAGCLPIQAPLSITASGQGAKLSTAGDHVLRSK
jgi:hypothetical protein